MKVLTPFLLIAASFGLFYMVVMPQYKNLKDLRARVVAYDEAIDQAKDVISKRDQLVAKKKSFSQEDIDKLETLLPDTIDNIRLIIDVNSVANKHKVDVEGVHVTGDSKQTTPSGSDPKPYGYVTIGFSVKLSYDEFLKFMNDLEHSLKLLEPSTITVAPTEDGTPYTYTVSLKTYWLKS